jgi:hypothetical protein
LTSRRQPRVHALGPADSTHHARPSAPTGTARDRARASGLPGPAGLTRTRRRTKATGNTYKQCGCRDRGGKRLGQQCPKLRRPGGTWSATHGRWYYQVELPPRADGTRRPPLRKGGFDTVTGAEAGLRQARELLAIAGGDT